MESDAISLFRELAGRSSSEREEYYVQHRVPDDIRADVESLLTLDDNAIDSFAGHVASAAIKALFEDAPATGPQPARAVSTLQPGTIGRYQVARLLGRGGMSEVYLARDPVLERDVAVKLIAGELDDQTAQRRLVREARAAGRLQHPNIVTIFDAGEHEGRPYIAMEYVCGETLRSVIQQKAPLSLARKLELIEGACAGLAHAHRAGVVHLDIKPDNLMLDESGVVKVLDFGIARVLQGEALATRHIVGTLRYMSPEQIAGEPLDRRSDVFSLGCSLFELLAYEPAYAGSTKEIVTRIAIGPVPRLLDAIPDIDPRLDAIVSRAMALEPSARFDDLDELRGELARLRGATDTAERLPTATPGAIDPARAWRSRVAASIAVGFLLIAGVGTYLISSANGSSDSEAVVTTPQATAADPVAEPIPSETTGAPGSAARGAVSTSSVGEKRPQAVAPDLNARSGQGAAPPPATAGPPPLPAAQPQRITERIPPAQAPGIPPPVMQTAQSPAIEPPRPEPAPPRADAATAPAAGSAPAERSARDQPAQTPPPSDQESVLETLRIYSAAYESLDVAQVLQVYPSLGAEQVEQLRRAFAGMATYEVSIRNTRVDVQSDVAVVRGVVARRMTPRVGQRVVNEVETEFRLQKTGGGWVITAVTAK
jgi:serine/threonine protein kinase